LLGRIGKDDADMDLAFRNQRNHAWPPDVPEIMTLRGRKREGVRKK